MGKIFSYDLDADRKLRIFLSNLIRDYDDLQFAMGESARITKKANTANFILSGAGRYPKLSPAYVIQKKKLAPSAPILVGAKLTGGISGKLRDSIIKTTTDSILNVGKLSFSVGTKAKSKKGTPYAKFVQEGTNKMPARKYLFFTQAVVDQIINTTNAEIKSKWVK